ncbi:FRG domain-containing protein [Rodentibacter caecimuris]|uniref:FRG domain-containing protein n=1 Tax=Rodentibacter caecimuris TaxID=1796644 RepID=UPI0013A098F6|nr:FRG domain-containing protein [Rodentibacter heylii]QIA76484.1 FRG domain-containing protein [Rodentibacter heylii]
MTSMCKQSIPEELQFWEDSYQEKAQDKNLNTDKVFSRDYIRKSEANNLNFVISSYVPSIKIKSYDALRCLLYTEHFDGVGSDWVFRGHRDHNWRLESTLERIGSKSLDLREAHLNQFRKECRRIFKDKTYLSDMDENDFWAIGQHYDLATPLLDWTQSPYVALFFAFEHQQDDDNYRVIYALNKTKLVNLFSKIEVQEQLFFEPSKDPFGRLVNQSGLFTIAPYCTTLEDMLIDNLRRVSITKANDIANYICKIYIKSSPSIRKNCLLDLRQMNIHRGTLCPDLNGAALYCNHMIKEQYGIDC